MFAHTCTSCHRRELIFPSQITGLESTDRGILVHFTCWCDARQTMLTGARAPRPSTDPVATASAA